jgi:hypothetical protein
LTIVLSNFGTTYTAGLSAGIRGLPEPSCLVLLSVGAVGLAVWAASVKAFSAQVGGGKSR